MMKKRRGAVLGLVLLGLLFALGGRLGWRPAAAQETAAVFDAADCTVVVSPPDSLQAAVDAMSAGQTLCARGGVYNQTLAVPSEKPGLTIIAYPGEQPIIDGQKRLPGGPPTRRFAPLVAISGEGTVFDGFEVRFSTARGVEVNGNNAVVRNSSVHDNWEVGLIVRRSIASPVSGVLIENNRVYNNLLKARYIPVIYRGERSGSGPTDWLFDPDVLWDTPFWTGADKDLPESWVNDISMTFNDDGRTARIYAGSARSGRVGYIGPEFSATGQQFSYSGADILFYDPATNLWTDYFNGDAMGSQGLNGRAVIDAFQIESQSAPPECPACTPIVMSFGITATVPISGTATTIGRSDLVRFSPTAIGAYGQITAGTFTQERTAASLGLPAGANIDALDRTPEGQLLFSFNDPVTLGGQTFSAEDLALYDETQGTWTLYFDGDNIPYNPFPDDLKAAWLDRAGNIYVSGDPVGGSALTFLYAQDSVARGNTVYNNYGEGLVAGRYTTRITLEDNVLYDNEHANLYLNATTYPLVQRNVVFCTDDPRFWRKGSATDYRPGPGIQVRDEDFEGQEAMPPPSTNQVIVNNLVVGCSTNFGVATQRAAGQGGLQNALVAHNVFANARGESAVGITNVEFNTNASYDNTRFVNNLILQSPAGASAQGVGGRDAAFATLTLANNLYSAAPKGGWPGGESGRLVADPGLAGGAPPLPVMGAIPDPADYRLSYASPAFDAGLALPEVAADILGQSRVNTGLPDIGALELPYVGVIVVAQQTTPDSNQPFDFATTYAPNAFILADEQTHNSGPLAAGDYSIAIAPPAGWVANGSCDDGSAPDAVRLDPGETVTCTFQGERLPRLTVANETQPANDPQTFDFSLTPGESFQLAGGGRRDFDLAPGVYALTATLPPGWQRTGASCDNGDAPDALSLAMGEQVTCTFTSQQPTRLTVVNNTQPANDPQTFDFSLTPGESFQLAGGGRRAFDLLAGSYALTATTPDGWQRTGASCDNGDAPDALSLDVGDQVTCTFTHRRLGRIVIEKQTLPDGATQVFAFSASYDADGFSLGDGQRDTSAFLAPGTYAVAETLPAGWAQDSATCDDGSAPAAIDLGAGETVTCVFTNARAELTLSKTPTPTSVVAPGGDVAFAVRVANSGATALQLTALSDSVFGDVANSGNAALVSTTCALPQSLAAGQTYDCAFTAHVGGTAGANHHNTLTATAGTLASATAEATVAIVAPAQGHIVVAQQTSPANTPGSFDYTTSYSAGFSLSHGQSRDSGPLASNATYSVSQTLPAGWTLSSAVCTDGSNPASIALDPGETVTCTFTNQRTTTGPTGTFYLTAATAGQVGGVSYAAGDIVAYNGTTGVWSLVFDGSDVGWLKAIGDFEFLPDGSLLLTNSTKQTLGTGAARFTLEVQDIARFVPTTLGTATAGTFSLYFDGSDVALSTADERIDALARKTDGTLLISTAGRATVKNGGTSIVAQDEDLLAFRPGNLGATTSGTWNLASDGFDGSLLTGMGAENVTGAWRDPASGDLYLTVVNAFTIGGVSGNQRTILRVTPARAVSAYWNAATYGFPGGIDGLSIAP